MKASGGMLALSAWLLLCVVPVAGQTGQPTAAADYFALQGSAAVAQVPFDTVRLNPRQYEGALIEIRGTISGHARRADGILLILNSPELGTYLVEAKGELAGTEATAGQSVRVLARVPEGTVVSRLSLAALVSEFEAAGYEARNARQLAAARMRQSAAANRPARQPLGSRGGPVTRGRSVLEQYAQAVQYFNPRLSSDQAVRIARSIIQYSSRYGLDARLVMAVVAVESNFNAQAVSHKGAMGLGQLMPGTASDLGVMDPWNPEQNLEGSTRLLSGHLARMAAQGPTEEAIRLALACYNAGAGAVKKHGGIPPYRETRNYVRKVTRLYYQMCGQPVPE